MEAPPPYPGLKTPQQGENPNPLQPVRDADLKTCIHPHTVLAVESPTSTALHYWSSPPSVAVGAPLDSRPHIVISTKLEPRDIQLIRGCRDLGSFMLPITDNDIAASISQFFSSLVDNVNYDVSPSSEIIARLSAAPPTHGSLPIQVFAIPVQSDTANGLTGDPAHKPVWKWSKPDSHYEPKTGYWEADVDVAIEDGEWRAGKDLQLLVRGATAEEVEALRNRRTNPFD
ncbi:hypothetical protein F4804DRAFT_335502 [Jackrogersella minutella]|nr:hypothetical protein F4804DRAFT_335502 [Jackrogersella minutella]